MLGRYCVIQVLDGLSSWTFLAKQVAYFKALSTDTSIFSQRERVVPQKAKNVLLQHTQKMELEHKRSRLRSLILSISLYLRFAFRVWIFLLFVILAGPHFATSHFLVSCRLAHSKFLQISSHCDTMTWANDMQYCDNNSNNNDDNDYDNDCGTVLCSMLLYVFWFYTKIHYLTREFHVKLHAKTDIGFQVQFNVESHN